MSIDIVNIFANNAAIKEEEITDKKGNKFLCFHAGSMKCCAPLAKRRIEIQKD